MPGDVQGHAHPLPRRRKPGRERRDWQAGLATQRRGGRNRGESMGRFLRRLVIAVVLLLLLAGLAIWLLLGGFLALLQFIAPML